MLAEALAKMIRSRSMVMPVLDNLSLVGSKKITVPHNQCGLVMPFLRWPPRYSAFSTFHFHPLETSLQGRLLTPPLSVTLAAAILQHQASPLNTNFILHLISISCGPTLCRPLYDCFLLVWWPGFPNSLMKGPSCSQ